MKKAALWLCMIFLVFSFTGCMPPGVSMPSSSGSSQNSGVSESTETSEADAESESNVYKIGDTAILGDWEITVTSAEFMSEISDNSYEYFTSAFHPEEGNVFTVVSVTVKNQGQEADTFLPSYPIGNQVSARLKYDNGNYEFNATNLLGYEKDIHDEFLNPLSSKEGIIAFDVVKSASEDDKSLSIEFSAKRESVVFNIK